MGLVVRLGKNPPFEARDSFPCARIVTREPAVPAKYACFCSKCHFFCFHTHSGFVRYLLTSFFLGLARRTTFASPSTLGPPLRRTICRAFPAFVWAFIHVLGASVWDGPVPHPSLPSQANPEPRCLVNRILAKFPTGRKRFYNPRRQFPTGRKFGLADFRFSTPRWHSRPGRRRGKNVETPGTHFRASGSTYLALLKTRDTVALNTPATCATSFIPAAILFCSESEIRMNSRAVTRSEQAPRRPCRLKADSRRVVLTPGCLLLALEESS
jgi:hypothetical protein